ncbi:cytochrome P450 [Phycomyces nitens]|nr:cytochrome P450 [Phycomyces nitens]
MYTALLPNLSTERCALPIAGALALGMAAKFTYKIFEWVQERLDQDSWSHPGYKKIPSPSKKYPYFGHMLSLKDTPGIQLQTWHKTLGPIIRLNMGVQNWVIINDPAIAHELFSRNGIKTSDRQKHKFTYEMYSKGGRGIPFNKTSKKWKNARNIAISILSPKYVERFSKVLETIIEKAIDQLESETEKDGSVSPMHHLKVVTFSAMLRSLLGRSAEFLDAKVLDDIIKTTEVMFTYSGPEGDIDSFVPQLAWINRLSRHREEAEAIICHRDNLYKKLIQDALEGDKNCLLNQMHALRDEYELDETDLLVMTSDLISAGGDPTALSLAWLFAILSQNPGVQTKMQSEIDSFVRRNGRKPEFSDREALPYTISVLLENIRFRSVTNFGVPHLTTQDVEFLGYFIPKDTVVISSMHAMHMNENVYENADKFIPERFSGNRKTWSSSSNGSFNERDMYAFGWGRRICPGIHFAEAETFSMCVRTLARCTIEPAIGLDGKPDYVDLNSILPAGLNFSPKEYKVKFTRRTSV